MNKNYTEVTIDDRTYTLGGYEDEEYLQQVAAYLNTKTAELRKVQGYLRQSPDFRRMMLDLNIADDLFKARRRIAALETRLQVLEKENSDLRHELVTNRIRYEKEKTE